MITLILSIIAVFLGVFATAAATLSYLKSDSTAKKMRKADGQSEKNDPVSKSTHYSDLKELKKECLSETDSKINEALANFETKLKSHAKVEDTPQSPTSSYSVESQVYPSQTWYARFMIDQFDEIDFCEVQSPQLSFIIRTTSDTTAEVSLNPEFDRNLISEVRDTCDVVEGSWMNFNTVTVLSDGIITKKSKDSKSWNIEKKIVVKLS